MSDNKQLNSQAIVGTYPCPALLREALLAAPEPSRLPLLTNIRWDLEEFRESFVIRYICLFVPSLVRIGIEGKRKLPKTIAEAVIKFWTSDCIL